MPGARRILSFRLPTLRPGRRHLCPRSAVCRRLTLRTPKQTPQLWVIPVVGAARCVAKPGSHVAEVTSSATAQSVSATKGAAENPTKMVTRWRVRNVSDRGGQVDVTVGDEHADPSPGGGSRLVSR